MRSTVTAGVIGTLVIGLALAAPAESQAQVIWGGEYERALRPGAYVPYDGMPWTQRYSYEYGPGFYLGMHPGYIYSLDYLDRWERASDIGLKYQSPWNPYGKTPLFNRITGQTQIEYPAPTPPPYLVPDTNRLRFQLGVGYYFAR
jgi:hypothetical protein